MSKASGKQTGSTLQLLLCVGSIYIAYLSWAVLQERIATTPYGPDKRIFRASFVLNTAQSIAATVTGSLYLVLRGSGKEKSLIKTIYPSRQVLYKFVLISLTSSLASPFGYASLKYIDYPTQILGKSCKMLPVIALGVLVYGRRFPPHKYLVVLLVTAGVAMFTLFNGKSHGKARSDASSSWYGLTLLSINLLLDGLTNSTQDQMFKQFTELTGPSMMIGQNLMSSAFITTYLLSGMTTELSEALHFMNQHPAIIQDICLFALCGAVGQLAIFYTLEKFGSLVLVTVTLTRKMFTMLLSVIWFNHKLTTGQYVAVALVFGGISAEALFKKQDDAKHKPSSPAHHTRSQDKKR